MTSANQLIEMWVNGKILGSPTVKYVDGQMHKFVIDLDRLIYQSLVDMYMSCGGRKSVVNFYFKQLGVPLDVGLRIIRYDLVDITMCDLVSAYDRLDPDIHISTWVEEIADPIEMQLKGLEGLKLKKWGSNNETVPEINKETVGEDNTNGHIGLEELEEHDDIEQVEELRSEAQYEDYFAEWWDVFLQEEADVPADEMPSDAISQNADKGKGNMIEERQRHPRAAEKGKGQMDTRAVKKGKAKVIEKNLERIRKATEKGKAKEEMEGVEPAAVGDEWEMSEGEESDIPSFMLEDIEGSSDDDIFIQKNPSKAYLVNKLKKFMAQNNRPTKTIPIKNPNHPTQSQPLQEDWYSDVAENDELIILDGSDDENGGQHTCARTFDNKLAKTSYIAKRIENLIKDNPFVSSETLVNSVHRKCGVELSRAKMARAMREAIEKIAGHDSKEYALLWDCCETVRAKNPGILILLRKQEGVEPPVFDKMYYSLTSMGIGFLAGCRPIIGLDGCFLKIIFGGQLLVALGRDVNDNMWPIAMAAVKIENYENWKWFLYVLLRAGMCTQVVFQLFWRAACSADKYVVDLALMTCTCGMFQLSGYPCCHAIAAIAERRTKTKNYVDDCYSKQAYLKVYENMIHVVPGQRDYIKTTFQVLRAPPVKRKRGRPRKNRIRGPGENLNSTRAGLTHTCQNCLQLGHNKASCTNPTHPASKWYKGPVAAEAQPSDAPQHVSQPVGTDAPQPTQNSQDDPVAQPVPRPQKQQTRGRLGTYAGRRNAELLRACTNLNQGGSSNVPTRSGSNAKGADTSAIPTGRSSGATTSQGTSFGKTTAATNSVPVAPNPPPRRVEVANNYSVASNIAPETVQK
ncbi:hypothetical protein BUALT_Bualt01G0077600 [Buddleja alternifolia]|uniref:SWIM-type domain-containing protein n=1 Tax=Buddleja alternifolia TaxID=168488 RepID=A0AAV6YD51_9LAMI|nr:hypothetical protein BUALT_Bualt01G0077600 [Buddleja alternifolia]